MTHIIIYLILAFIIYGAGHANGKRAVMGQVKDAAQSFKDFLK